MFPVLVMVPWQLPPIPDGAAKIVFWAETDEVDPLFQSEPPNVPPPALAVFPATVSLIRVQLSLEYFARAPPFCAAVFPLNVTFARVVE